MPAIVLVSTDHADVLLDELGRYARDYDLHAATTFEDGARLVPQLQADGTGLALMVADPLERDSVVPLVHAWLAPERGLFNQRVDNARDDDLPSYSTERLMRSPR